MFVSLGKLACGPCCPLEEAKIQAREERIEARRARIETKITAGLGPDSALPDPVDVDQGKAKRSSSGSSDGSGDDSMEGADEGEGEGVSGGYVDDMERQYLSDSPSGSEESEDLQVRPDPFYVLPVVEEEETDIYKQNFEKQKEQSRQNVAQIMKDGETWITNVKVAAEFREWTRRERVKTLRKERFQKIQEEAAACEEMYRNLQEGWNVKAEKILPLELYEKIQEQQRAADRVLERKEVQIEELRQILDENDWEFEEVLGFYQKDIMLMGDRIDEHMDNLFTSFLNELTLIEEHMEREESEMLREYEEELEEMMESYEKAERDSLEERQAQALNRFGSMGEKYQSVKEEMRTFRRKLEDDYRTLVLLFENYKFASLLNTEKLDYNLKVVRRREIENLTMRSSLKRAVLKFRDVFTSLQQDFRSRVQNAKVEAKQVIKEANRLHEYNSTAARSLLHMATVDHRKFMDLWLGSEEEGRRRVDLLLDIQEFVFKRMLGITLPKYDLAGFEDRPKEVHAFIHQLDYDVEMLKAESGDPGAWGRKTANSNDSSGMAFGESESTATVAGTKAQTPSSLPPSTATRNPSLILDWSPSIDLVPESESDPIFHRRVMTHLTQVVGEETGFLLESKLRKMLGPMPARERSLVQFDAVLNALGIVTVEDLQLLARYMLKNCTVMKGVLAKFDDAGTPLLESMNVSLDELPSTFTSTESVALERIRTQMLERLYAAVEEDGEEEEEHKADSHPKIIYCDEIRRGSSEELIREMEALGEGYENYGRVPSIVDQEAFEREEASFEGAEATDLSPAHSTGSMDTPEGCRRRTLSFNTAEGMVMTWYKKGSSLSCQCEKPGGICICDGEEEDVKVTTEGPPPTVTSQEFATSATASIVSLESSTESQDLLYIPPNDVLVALAGFLKDFNAKTKLTKPTNAENVRVALSKLRLPSVEEMREYWNRFLPFVKHFDCDGFWESLLNAFAEYHVMLKERNQHVLEVEAIRRQNEELARLLHTHMGQFPGSNLDLNRVTLPYC